MVEQARVLLVDDHDVVREGLRALLRRRDELVVVGEADSVASAIEAARASQPDVVVMDVRLPDGTGVQACRAIRAERPDTKVIMLTSYADDEAVLASIMAGASGYLLKQTRGQDLLDAIGRVLRGESLLDPVVTSRVLERVRSAGQGKPDELSLLSEQERKILDLIAEGKTNKEIAEDVFLSDKTVKNYVSSILSKLDLRRRSEAAAFIARRQTPPPQD
ncbi:MAG: response regulator transcription factor [Dehalococcoidia bacterium]